MTSKRQNISSGSSYEEKYGYSRAVKVNDTVYISGTVGFNYQTGEISSDPVEQVQQIIRNIEPALEKAGAKLSDVVQISTYVTAPEILPNMWALNWEKYSKMFFLPIALSWSSFRFRMSWWRSWPPL